MTVDIVLKDKSAGLVDRVHVDCIADRKHFKYLDNENCQCNIDVYDDGICLYKQSKEYSLLLSLKGKGYAKIISAEGEIEIEAKVVDFIENDDILVVHYIIDDIEREIQIIYRS